MDLFLILVSGLIYYWPNYHFVLSIYRFFDVFSFSFFKLCGNWYSLMNRQVAICVSVRNSSVVRSLHWMHANGSDVEMDSQCFWCWMTNTYTHSSSMCSMFFVRSFQWIRLIHIFDLLNTIKRSFFIFIETKCINFRRILFTMKHVEPYYYWRRFSAFKTLQIYFIFSRYTCTRMHWASESWNSTFRFRL